MAGQRAHHGGDHQQPGGQQGGHQAPAPPHQEAGEGGEQRDQQDGAHRGDDPRVHRVGVGRRWLDGDADGQAREPGDHPGQRLLPGDGLLQARGQRRAGDRWHRWRFGRRHPGILEFRKTVLGRGHGRNLLAVANNWVAACKGSPLMERCLGRCRE
jgi:hypothetical protein